MNSTTYNVVGMTCSHCVSAVRSEISGVPGVTGVDIDLATGAVKVSSDQEVDPQAIAAAVVEAGYEVAS